MEQNLALTTTERKTIDLADQINGWGVDLDPRLRPGVPRDKAPMVGVETLYPPIEQQIPYVKINKSIEHGRLTPVFGTTCPPSGVSGVIRNFAYRFSEGQAPHWILLLMADRINMVEGVLGDLARGKIPNLYEEMGLKSEWKYNRKNFQRKVALLSAGTIAATALFVWLRGQSESRRHLYRSP